MAPWVGSPLPCQHSGIFPRAAPVALAVLATQLMALVALQALIGAGSRSTCSLSLSSHLCAMYDARQAKLADRPLAVQTRDPILDGESSREQSKSGEGAQSDSAVRCDRPMRIPVDICPAVALGST